MAQKRIRELTEYIQLNPGDPGYVNPSSLFLPIDSTSFAGEALKYSIESILSGAHIEANTILNPSSAAVSVTFGTSFTSTPMAIHFDCYRYYQVEPGKYVKKDVQFYYSGANWLTSTGFAITIESTESLTGVYLEYYFIEN